MTSIVHIIGGAQTDFQRNWSKEGKTFIAMMREVISDALSDTGIDFQEIIRLNKKNKIGIFLGNFDGEQYFNQGHLGAFFTEIHPSFFGVPGSRFEAACASGSVAIDAAATKIRVGDYDLAIVLGIEVMKTVSSAVGGDFLGTAAYYEKEAKNISFPFPKLFGQLADVYLSRYQLDENRFLSNLAEISSINYHNAKLNPLAQTRSWFMNKNHACHRQGNYNISVGGKLSVTDCSQVTDGAACIILASPKYSSKYLQHRHLSKANTLSTISGWGHRVAPVLFSEKISESSSNLFVLPWTRQAVLDALSRAKLSEKQIDFYETHDCFTSSEYAAISAFGLTPPGKEYEVIENGSITISGKNPINPSGGLIGVGHPVGATGVRMLLDLHRQVTHQAGNYQVANSDHGLMLNIGGSATTNYVFVVSRSI
ncbi:acetyl-CoA acetyltransferase [Patescibacteria group bacterium]|nr:acetyl-CoA acetyltransferase [Patescibacteria group bacterium]